MEEALNTYGKIGIPDSLAVAIVLVALSLTLAPWFGGLEIGPVKVPELPLKAKRYTSAIAPIVLIALLAGFYPAWRESDVIPVQAPEKPFDRNYSFEGSLGEYWIEGTFYLSKACTFDGTIHANGNPTGGNTNAISGDINEQKISFTRTLAGQNAGQTDHFSGTLIEDGRKMIGKWTQFEFSARLTPSLERCDP